MPAKISKQTSQVASATQPADLTNNTTQKNSLSDFLLDRKVAKGQPFTHTSLANPAGAFAIPPAEVPEFIQLYKKALRAGTPLHLTEKHDTHSPVLIDLDFRHDENKRFYTQDDITAFIRYLVPYIRRYIDQDVMTCYVLEKPAPRPDPKNPGIFKDGIHFIFPDVVTAPAIQYEIRRNMLDESTLPLSYDNIEGHTEEAMYDEAVIERNNWFLYGSNKPDEPHHWRVTHKYAMTLDEREPQELSFVDGPMLVTELSIRDPNKAVSKTNEWGDDIIAKYNERKTQTHTNTSANPTNTNGSTNTNNANTSAIDMATVAKLVDMLSDKRTNEYDLWIRVMWCLINIASRGPHAALDQAFAIFDAFSKRSPKYNATDVRDFWRKYVHSSSSHSSQNGIGSLCMWAKEDSPAEYAKLRSHICVFNDILHCNGTHNSIAAILYKLFKGTYVCAEENGKLWYRFNGTLWVQDGGNNALKRDITNTLGEHVRAVMENIRQQNQQQQPSATPASDTASVVSVATTAQTSQEDNGKSRILKRLQEITEQLQNYHFKKALIAECVEFFYDAEFLDKLDSNPNILAFTNGVWEFKEKRFRPATPTDYCSMSVGYDYNPKVNEEKRAKVAKYWRTLHPNEAQRNYTIKMLARQLYGDDGNNYFHVHAGRLASAANGKTKHFEILTYALGKYVRKFDVSILTSKQRFEFNKPIPEFQYWRGVRILYCTEPNAYDIINAGIMKDLTGGEEIQYRLLYSNVTSSFRPMYKMHIMCNDTPKIDGGDNGVRRRIRKLDYISRFVVLEEVDESQHKYLRDPQIIDEFRDDPEMKMEFLRYILDEYDHANDFKAPPEVEQASRCYLDENDAVFAFTQEYLVEDATAHFTLKEAKEAFKRSDYYNGAGSVNKLKNDLIKTLGIPCVGQVRINGVRVSNVFNGYKLVEDNDFEF